MKAIILASLILSGCTNVRVNEHTALKQCRNYNVKCFKLKDTIPDITVEILGSDVQKACGNKPVLGCLVDGKHIKMWENDWQVYSQEYCHAVCLPGGHYYERTNFDWMNK